MALTVTVTPGKQFAETETVTIPKLNQLGQPTFTVTGTAGTAEVTNGSITAAKTIADAHFYTASVSFSAGDYTLTYSPTITINDGTIIAFKANANGVPNAGTGIRLIIGASTKKLFKNKTETMQKGDLVTNQIIEARYDTAGDGGAGAWQMTSQVSTRETYFTATATGTNSYSLTVTPPVSYPYVVTDSELQGKPIRFKVPNTNTGSCTIALTIGGTALSALPLYKNYNNVPIAGDLQKEQIMEVVLVNDATHANQYYNLQSSVGNWVRDSAVLGTSRNLTISNNAAAPNSKIDFALDEVVLRDSDGRTMNQVLGASGTIDIDVTSGPNARDYATAEANVWHYIWMISDGTGVVGTCKGLLSQSATAPNMPGGYTYKALVGAVYNNVNLTQFVQWGNEVNFADTNIFTAKNAAAADTYEILAGADLTAFRNAIPPIARTCSGVLGSSSTANNAQHSIAACDSTGAASTSAFGAVHVCVSSIATAHANFASSGYFRVLVRGSANYNVQWKARLNAGLTARLNVSGFTL